MINIPSSCDVLIIGGGATGVGICRDLAMRGVSVVLVEQKDFGSGASGANHGLLHSGARYAVSDKESAKECAGENNILRKIAPFCIDDTGGLFVSFPEDDVFVEEFERGCRASGVCTEELSTHELWNEEPLISSEAEKAFKVRDAAVDPFLLLNSNIMSAREFGAVAVNYTKVTKISTEVSLDRLGKKVTTRPEIIINAAGAWAPEIAAMAGQELSVGLDKGTMVVIDGRITKHVVNRLRKPADGDILVPHHSATILGTTSCRGNLNNCRSTADEVELLLREASKMIPGIHSMRSVRAYSGIRPLAGTAGRNASRNFNITNTGNLISVVGGKLTTYRLIAEKVSDEVSKILGIRASCRTDKEELPAPEPNKDTYESCTCEMVSKDYLALHAASEDVVCTADLMRRTRAGMGFCQGSDCVFDMASCINGDLLNNVCDFMADRWKGIQPVLFDQQLRQEAFKAHLFKVYDIDHTGCD